jgi:hypothetical protein
MAGSGDVALVRQLLGHHAVDGGGHRGIAHLALGGTETGLGLGGAGDGHVVVELHLLVVLTRDHLVLVEVLEALVVGFRVLPGVLGLLHAEAGLLDGPLDVQGIDGEQALAHFHRLAFHHGDVADVAHQAGGDTYRFKGLHGTRDGGGGQTFAGLDDGGLGMDRALGFLGGLGFVLAGTGGKAERQGQSNDEGFQGDLHGHVRLRIKGYQRSAHPRRASVPPG